MSRPRPVLMPGGWPDDEVERETCARALLASGGDFDRIYDEPDLGLDAYIRHIVRVPFFKLSQENPIVLVSGRLQTVVDLLEFYTRLYELTDQFDKASWIAYLTRNRLDEFLSAAESWGDIEYMGADMYCWYTSPAPILVISGNSYASNLRRAVADLEQAPESGVIALGDCPAPSTQPAPVTIQAPPATSSGLSSGSIARLRLQTQNLTPPQRDEATRTPTPPGNPRIRRNTG